MSLAFCCGDLWCALGFQLLLPERPPGGVKNDDHVGKHWRQVLLWIGIPPCLLLAFGLLSPVARVDTAYFLAARGQVESVKALELMASMNGKRVRCFKATSLVWGLIASNLLLLSVVLWLETGSQTSANALPDHDLLLPLLPEIQHRALWDVNLFDHPDEPYANYPTEAKIVTTSCVIDTVQAATYLGKAVVNIYRAEICPDDEPLGCTAPVAHTITSFIWVMAFLTSAASTCAATLDQAGSCVAAIMRDLATAGSTIYGFDEDCFLTHPRDTSWRVFQRWWKHLAKPEKRRLRGTDSSPEQFSEPGPAARDLPMSRNISAYRRKSSEIAERLRNLAGPGSAGGRAILPNVLFDAQTKGLPRDLVSAYQKVKTIDAKHKYKTERDFALANCVFDSVAAVTWITRALLSIEEAARNCPAPKACAVDILYVIGAFSYGAQVLSLAFVDCPKRGKREALCGADVTDVIGSISELTVREEKPVSITVALQSLTTREHSLSVLALSVMFFVKDLAFYGMGAFFPIAWRKSTLLTGLKPATELLCTAAVGLPGVVVAMLLIFSLPRRVAYSLSATACAIGAYAVRGIVDKENVLGVVQPRFLVRCQTMGSDLRTGVVFYKLFYPTAQMITFLFPAEVFSTQIRVWSMSIIAFCGRMAPLAVPVLIHTFQHLRSGAGGERRSSEDPGILQDQEPADLVISGHGPGVEDVAQRVDAPEGGGLRGELWRCPCGGWMRHWRRPTEPNLMAAPSAASKACSLLGAGASSSSTPGPSGGAKAALGLLGSPAGTGGTATAPSLLGKPPAAFPSSGAALALGVLGKAPAAVPATPVAPAAAALGILGKATAAAPAAPAALPAASAAAAQPATAAATPATAALGVLGQAPSSPTSPAAKAALGVLGKPSVDAAAKALGVLGATATASPIVSKSAPPPPTGGPYSSASPPVAPDTTDKVSAALDVLGESAAPTPPAPPPAAPVPATSEMMQKVDEGIMGPFEAEEHR
eukprot:g21032.t1